jgi:hypothetical protein
VKQYQLYVKLLRADPWSYCDTYTDASVAWAAQLLARHRGCITRVITAKAVDMDATVVNLHG